MQNPQQPVDPVVQQVLGQQPPAPQTNNGQPDGTPTQEQVRQNRVNLMREQQRQTNEPFDPTTGLPVQNMGEEPNAQTPPQVPPVQTPPVQQPPPVQTPPQQQPPVVQQPVQQQPPIQQQPPVQTPVQQPVQQPVQTQVPGQDPIQQQFQQQPPVDPNAPQPDPNAPQLTPEEQQTVQRLEQLMQEPQQQQIDPTQAAILQNQQMLLQMMQQNPQLAQLPMMGGQSFAPPAPQQQFTPPASAMGQTDPFSWDANQQQTPFAPQQPLQQLPQNPAMMGGVDPTNMLFGQAIQALTQQVHQLQQTNTQMLNTSKRERDIQNMMAANGISRIHAERAQDYFDQGNHIAGAEVVNLAAAPVIAKRMATQERDVRRDAAGQPLAPAPQGGVFQAPNNQQAIQQELNNIQLMPKGDQRTLAIIGFVQRNPEYAAAVQQGALQQSAA